jgi:phenylpropionate dioxygenase-like ring-hydroxylating dioxygenase large terminal subunit
MTTDVQTGIRDLVQENRVHRAIYTDPAVFELEMKRIFSRSWVFIGHESEVPHPGDYKTDTVAGQPIVMTRDEEGTVHVLFNRCRHRGAKVCNLPYGNSSTFSCLYHGWTFSNKGDLIAVPSRQLCPADFDPGNYPLNRLPRVDSYRGFIFGSLSPEGMPLEEHLGRAAHYLDCLIDRSPESEIQVCKPVMYSYPANWKLQIENYSDNIHARFTHEAAFAARRPIGAVERYGTGPQQRSDLRMGINRVLGHGDSMTDYRGDRSLMAFAGRDPEYVDILAAKHGVQRAQEIAEEKREKKTEKRY